VIVLNKEIIKRPKYLEKIMRFVDIPTIKVLTGIRRCGKSNIIFMVMDELESRGIPKENLVYFDFSEPEWEDEKMQVVFEKVKSKLAPESRTYLFLDEVQEIKSWERMVNTLNQKREFNVDVYITGSNSRMLSTEIETYLTGRITTIPVFTLSFAEYLEFKKRYKEIGNPKDELYSYIEFGGFPATHLREMGRADIYMMVKDIYNTVIYTDIVKRNQIRKVDLFERIVKFVFANVGSIFSSNSISKYIKSEQRKIDVETVYSYLEKLSGAHILKKCARYDLKGKEVLKTFEKYYLADTSLRHAILGFNKDSFSGLLENVIYIELLRRGCEVYVGKYNDLEIDFVAEMQGERIYIQVAQEIRDEKTIDREYENLLKIQDNYPKYVLSTQDLAAGNYEGIKSMHIADWLMAE
jgi:predicted AAA+ superfamily ATPase